MSRHRRARGRWWETPVVPAGLEHIKPGPLANRAVAAAIKAGALRQPNICVVCGKQARCWHHWSYLPEHWLDVAELCLSCHGLVHSGKMPEPKTGIARTKEQRSRIIPPRAMVQHLAVGGAAPKTPTHPAQWGWAAAYLAANPIPVGSGLNLKPEAAERQYHQKSLQFWSSHIPEHWTEVDLSVPPYTSGKTCPGERDAINLAWDRHEADQVLIDRIAGFSPWLTPEERAHLVMLAERAATAQPPMRLGEGLPVGRQSIGKTAPALDKLSDSEALAVIRTRHDALLALLQQANFAELCA